MPIERHSFLGVATGEKSKDFQFMGSATGFSKQFQRASSKRSHAYPHRCAGRATQAVLSVSYRVEPSQRIFWPCVQNLVRIALSVDRAIIDT
jgi:hypothetical protein